LTLSRYPLPLLDCGGRALDLSRVAVMGVLNVTPDSFSDGGRHAATGPALTRARVMAEEGADIIDVGGESTRPGARPVGVQEDLDRVLPVIEGLRRELPLPISIDTSKPEVMRAAAAAGAGFINDVRALREPGALEAAVDLRLPVCLMHMRGDPRSMQEDPRYRDVVSEVRDFLGARIAACAAAGIPPARLVVDPGFGFGKALEHNLALLHGLASLAGLGVPLLVGLSRKSMIGALLGLPLERRGAASAALALFAATRGARIARVHDVAVTRDVLRTWEALGPDRRGGGGPAEKRND
jgi:dihydropteroate synthase